MREKKTTLGSHFSNGEIIFKQGTTGDCLYVIQEGNVDIIIESDDKETKVAELSEKDFFGEMALFQKDVRSCTVRANGDVKVLTINKRNFYKTIQNDPSLAFNLLEKMSKRLRDTTKKLKE
ncbi:MAG: cyclic nucleotide-binding domain-containing protein [Mariniphaga sp.]|nr:cyclic nucleotide-binding domain-containing protein [Mariniphaga sp.]